MASEWWRDRSLGTRSLGTRPLSLRPCGPGAGGRTDHCGEKAPEPGWTCFVKQNLTDYGDLKKSSSMRHCFKFRDVSEPALSKVISKKEKKKPYWCKCNNYSIELLGVTEPEERSCAKNKSSGGRILFLCSPGEIPALYWRHPTMTEGNDKEQPVFLSHLCRFSSRRARCA